MVNNLPLRCLAKWSLTRASFPPRRAPEASFRSSGHCFYVFSALLITEGTGSGGGARAARTNQLTKKARRGSERKWQGCFGLHCPMPSRWQ